MMQLICKQCAKQFEPHPKKKNKAKYCSRSCFQEYTKKPKLVEPPQKKEKTMNEKYAPVIIWGVLICLGLVWVGYNFVNTKTQQDIKRSLFLD